MAKTTEDDLIETIAEFTHDPLGFVKFAYPWGEENTPLETETGPEPWQRDILEMIADKTLHNSQTATRPFDPIRVAVASGHGVGKSALTAWLIHWILSTRPHCNGTVTANTGEQLKNRTWAQLAKWTQLLINKHWFSYYNTRGNMSIRQVDNKNTWFCAAFTCREENSESFAGQHSAPSSPFYIFDEASAIPDSIYEVANGGLTDGEPFFLLFGNPTRNQGYFHDCFGRGSHRWQTYQIDSREVSRTNKRQLDEWVQDYGEDSDFVRVRVRGVFPRGSTIQFIPGDIVARAMQTKIHEGEYNFAPRVIGADIARYGDDCSVIAKRQGLAVHKLLKFRETSTMEMANYIIAQIKSFQPHAVFVDGVGIGAGVVDRLRQLDYNVIDVNGGSKASVRNYYNLRAEMWDRMKHWLQRGGVLPNDVELEADLTGLEYGYTDGGALKLEKKEVMKSRGLRSPDCADALALTFAQDVAVAEDRKHSQQPVKARTEYDLFNVSGRSNGKKRSRARTQHNVFGR